MRSDGIDGNEALMQFLYRAPIGLLQTDLDGAIEMINPMSARLLMPLAPSGDLSNLFDVLAAVAPQLRGMARAHAEPSGIVCDALHFEVAGQRGEHRFLSLSLLKLDGARLMAALSDVTADTLRERERLAQRVSSAVRTDALTQLPNRLAFREQLQTLLERPAAGAGHMAVLFLNFDRFRHINEAYGNAAGDEVIAAMAQRLRAAMRPPSSTLSSGAPIHCVARLGGDEFAILLDNMRHHADTLGVAQRLLRAVSQPYAWEGRQIGCRVSMGIVTQDEMAGGADDVLRDASLAMLAAKRAGGDGLRVFTHSMREETARRSGLENELREALAQDQLFVVYQPTVGLQGGIDRGAGVEALVRWRHPVRGLVPPLEFIGVAEECGLIGAIGDFVLATACRDFMRWQLELGTSAPRSMAVNLSRAQLAQPGWTETVGAILRAAGMPADCLQLEVTESLAAQDDAVQARLHELKALGVRLALDDFGTGYSSLSSLHLLPVDTVKVDRSFVSQSATSQHHRVLIDATVRVARSLGMRTVAEGIETEAQAAVVRELGCDKGQGYLFSRPVPADVLAAWVVGDEKQVLAIRL